MLNLFKRQERITKFYQDLPPGDRIRRLFEDKIEPFLKDHDFKFIKSKNLFKRRFGQLTQEIYISKSKWNRGDEVCAFWLVFNITAQDYHQWHKQNYGTLPLNNGVTGFYHNHLKDWKTEYRLDKYDLSKYDNEKVFKEIKENIEKIILPLLDKFSNYEKSSDTLMEEKKFWMAAKIFDFYMMADKPEKAKQAILAGRKYFDKQVDPPKELFEAFEQRLNKT